MIIDDHRPSPDALSTILERAGYERGENLMRDFPLVQAHGDALWLVPASDGSAFRMRFPRDPA